MASLTPQQLRIVSAAVMAPVCLALMALGGMFFKIFIILISLIAYGEFLKLVEHLRPQRNRYAIYVLAGVLYIALTAFSLDWLRNEAFAQKEAYPQWLPLLMLLVSVWMTDTCAYFSGRTFKGPKLAPMISPNKTWSGLIGGVIGSSLALAAFAIAYDLPLWGIYVLIGGIVAVIAQIGDLFESHLKRKAGVKDSGKLIPGHGGVLDRIDGLLAAAPCFALFILLFS